MEISFRVIIKIAYTHLKTSIQNCLRHKMKVTTSQRYLLIFLCRPFYADTHTHTHSETSFFSLNTMPWSYFHGNMLKYPLSVLATPQYSWAWLTWFGCVQTRVLSQRCLWASLHSEGCHPCALTWTLTTVAQFPLHVRLEPGVDLQNLGYFAA